MRVEPHDIDATLHVIKRGARGMEIVRDEADRRRFVGLLFALNDEYTDSNRIRTTSTLQEFEHPNTWPERQPITQILAWTLMPNHFHLVLKETQEGGIATFMQRLCGSMSVGFNAKYNEKGSIFQGGYRGKVIDDDNYLRYLIFYVLVKNVMELYPGGLRVAIREFDRAWQWALAYPYSSLPVYAQNKTSPIVDRTLADEIWKSEAAFRKEAKEMLSVHMESRAEDLNSVLLEEW